MRSPRDREFPSPTDAAVRQGCPTSLPNAAMQRPDVRQGGETARCRRVPDGALAPFRGLWGGGLRTVAEVATPDLPPAFLTGRIASTCGGAVWMNAAGWACAFWAGTFDAGASATRAREVAGAGEPAYNESLLRGLAA